MNKADQMKQKYIDLGVQVDNKYGYTSVRIPSKLKELEDEIVATFDAHGCTYIEETSNENLIQKLLSMQAGLPKKK